MLCEVVVWVGGVGSRVDEWVGGYVAAEILCELGRWLGVGGGWLGGEGLSGG